jgi:hypothetical protein
MTLIVNEGGIVYKKEPGVQTVELARATSQYEPRRGSAIAPVRPRGVGLNRTVGKCQPYVR